MAFVLDKGVDRSQQLTEQLVREVQVELLKSVDVQSTSELLDLGG